MTPRSPETMAEGPTAAEWAAIVVNPLELTLKDLNAIVQNLESRFKEALERHGAEMRRRALEECEEIARKRAIDGPFIDIAAEQIMKKIRALIAKEKT